MEYGEDGAGKGGRDGCELRKVRQGQPGSRS